MMQLREDWPEKLNDYIDALRARPFTWDSTDDFGNDCCMMVDSGVFAMTGDRFLDHMRGYTDAPGAYAKLLSTYGGGVDVMIAAIAVEQGWAEVSVNHAHRGAVMLVDPQYCGGDPRFGGALGLCVGPWALVLTDRPVPDHLAAIERTCCLRSWNIQHPTGG